MEIDEENETASLSREYLEELCYTKGYLDGKYFVPCIDTTQSSESIIAKCILCDNQNIEKVIKGSLNAVSNFKTHIQVTLFQ